MLTWSPNEVCRALGKIHCKSHSKPATRADQLAAHKLQVTPEEREWPLGSQSRCHSSQLFHLLLLLPETPGSLLQLPLIAPTPRNGVGYSRVGWHPALPHPKGVFSREIMGIQGFCTVWGMLCSGTTQHNVCGGCWYSVLGVHPSHSTCVALCHGMRPMQQVARGLADQKLNSLA